MFLYQNPSTSWILVLDNAISKYFLSHCEVVTYSVVEGSGDLPTYLSATENWDTTPARTLSISGLKSGVLKLSFLT